MDSLNSTLSSVPSNDTDPQSSSVPPFSTRVATSTTIMAPYSKSTKLPSKDMDTGEIVGLVIGVLLVILVLVGITAFLVLRMRKKKAKKAHERREEEMLPSTSQLDEIENKFRSSNTSKKKHKKSKKNKIEKEHASVISVDPSSLPSCVAPEPPSTSSVGYENYKPYANMSYKNNSKNYSNDYLIQKPNTAKLYSTAEGAEYYVVDDNKVKQSNYQNPNPNTNSRTYANLRVESSKPSVKRNDFATADEPQDEYETMER